MLDVSMSITKHYYHARLVRSACYHNIAMVTDRQHRLGRGQHSERTHRALYEASSWAQEDATHSGWAQTSHTNRGDGCLVHNHPLRIPSL